MLVVPFFVVFIGALLHVTGHGTLFRSVEQRDTVARALHPHVYARGKQNRDPHKQTCNKTTVPKQFQRSKDTTKDSATKLFAQLFLCLNKRFIHKSPDNLKPPCLFLFNVLSLVSHCCGHDIWDIWTHR